MKKRDLLWLLVIMAIFSVFVMPELREEFEILTRFHHFLMVFLKFAIHGTLGELLGIRIDNGYWSKPVGMLWRIILWGVLGIIAVLAFPMFAMGVSSIISRGLLPSFNGVFLSKLTAAFFTSAFFNILFGPAILTLHRITDTYIVLCNAKIKNLKNISLNHVLNEMDWNGWVCVVCNDSCIFYPSIYNKFHTFTRIQSCSGSCDRCGVGSDSWSHKKRKEVLK